MTTTVDISGLERGLRAMALERWGRVADAFVDAAQQNASERSGELRRGIIHDPPVETSDGVHCLAQSTAEHSRYQEEGTGIYGPLGTPIRPRRYGGVLVFDWPAAGGVVFARSVSGSEPTRFWSRTFSEWPGIVRQA